MIGGAYALRVHTGIWRDTKDLDLFIRKDVVDSALKALRRAGYRTEFTDPYWIAKAYSDPYFVDLIFSSGNGIAIVDELWVRRAGVARVLDRDALVVPPEEMIWSKAFIQERERFDGADIHHLLRCQGARLDWKHLLMRFEQHWEVLFAHLVTFRFAFPGEKDQVPAWVMRDLAGRVEEAEGEPARADRISVKGGTAAWPYTLDEASQGRIAVRLTLGADRPWCAEARGSLDVVNEFVAVRDALPTSCPPLP